MTGLLRVFHSPIEIAGQMGCMVGGLQRFGHVAIGYNTFHTYLQYQNHIVNTDLGTIISAFDATVANYDVFHFHFGASLKLGFADLYQLKAMQKKVVMHHWGNDVRVAWKARTLSPWLQDPCNPYADDVMEQRLREMSAVVDTCIIQDYELYDYIQGYYKTIHILPLMFDVLNTIPAYPSVDVSIPLVVHAPTLPTFKGTSYIESTLDRLRADGYQFNYTRIERMDHATALSLYRQADLVIDQVSVGSYGTFAVEAMALGKPVVAHIRPDIAAKFPLTLPIIQADPSNLYAYVAAYLVNPDLRYVQGRLSRTYVEQYHDISAVMPQLISIYHSL